MFVIAFLFVADIRPFFPFLSTAFCVHFVPLGGLRLPGFERVQWAVSISYLEIRSPGHQFISILWSTVSRAQSASCVPALRSGRHDTRIIEFTLFLLSSWERNFVAAQFHTSNKLISLQSENSNFDFSDRKCIFAREGKAHRAKNVKDGYRCLCKKQR